MFKCSSAFVLMIFFFLSLSIPQWYFPDLKYYLIIIIYVSEEIRLKTEIDCGKFRNPSWNISFSLRVETCSLLKNVYATVYNTYYIMQKLLLMFLEQIPSYQLSCLPRNPFTY